MFSLKSLVILLIVLLTVVLSAADKDPQTESGDQKGSETNGDTTQQGAKEAGPKQKPDDGQSAAGTTVKPNNVSHAANTTGLGDGSRLSSLMENKGMLMRSFFVFLGITSIVVIYFGVKAWRTRRRKSKSRKYGLITSRGADLEMEPLDQDMDDDDDMTVFEVNGRQK